MFSTPSRVTARVPNGAKRQKRTQKIPVITQIFTDSTVDPYETARHLDLQRVINLIEDPLTRSMKERHIFALKKVVKRYQHGFLLRQLADIFKILNLCAEKSTDLPEYAATLCDLLHICRLPFLMEKASDEVNYASVVTDSLSQMGYLMRVPDTKVREHVCAAITSLYSCDKPKQYENVSGVCPTSLVYRQKLVERSGLAETLVMSLALMENQLSTKVKLLQALQVLSISSTANCSLMLKAEAAQKICFHMNEPDESGQVLFRSTEILWNLLENGSKEEVTKQLSSVDCIMVLKEAFLHQLLNGHQHYNQQLRNDLLVITTLIAENPNSTLIESGFAKQLILMATVPELKSHNPVIRTFKLTFNTEDFEMKKLLLNLLVVLSRDLSAVQLFKEGRVLLALMLLVRPSSSDRRPSGRGRRRWSSAQQEELQLQALAALSTLAPLMVDEYMSCQANTCLLMLLDWCTQKDSYFAQGHGFHSTGGRGGKKAHMRYCVRLLRRMVALSDANINQDLCDQGAVSQLLGLLSHFQDKEGEEDAVSVEIQTDVLITLSALCEEDMHRKELFGAEGVEMTIYYLKMNPARLYSGHGHNSLFLANIDCIWSCIVGCYTTEDLFLEKEGARLLLHFLHVSPRCMQSAALGTLLELCDNPKTLSHVGAWSGERELTAPALLLRLWRQEETELEVKRDEHGRIADVMKPLMSAHQEQQALVSAPADEPSPAVMDVSENLRAKIYAMFCKLGFEGLAGLDTGDYITLSTVNRYLDFKTGEVWSEVSAELELEGVRPITPDAETLSTLAKTSEDTASRVCSLQQSVLEQQEQEDLQEEKLAYKEMSLNRKQKELTAKSWERYVAKTSDYKILQESKLQQKRSIEASRTRQKAEGVIYHSAQIPGLQTTNFCGTPSNTDLDLPNTVTVK